MQDPLISPNPDDEVREEEVVSQLAQQQGEVAPDDISPKERRELNRELDHQNREAIPRPSEDGDADSGLDEREVAHDAHDVR